MPKHEKIPLEKVKKIHPEQLLKIINKAKEYLKNNETMQNIAKEYGCDVSIIDLFPTMFGDIDVSAKTDHGVVILNYKLLCDGDFFKDYSYLIHEYTHTFQQCFGDKPTKGADEGDYLKNPYEEEGFQNQIEYIADEFGEDHAEDYVDKLLDHHDKGGKEKEKLEEKLMAKV
jgi:hypothetical protein